MATTLVENQDFISIRFFGGLKRGVMVEEYYPATNTTVVRPATETEKRL